MIEDSDGLCFVSEFSFLTELITKNFKLVLITRHSLPELHLGASTVH